MSTWFVIEDDIHSEPQGEFATMEEAVDELKRRAQIPWDEEPNRAPCTSWRTCHRVYEIVEYLQVRPHRGQVRRVRALEISASGVRWAPNLRDS